MKVAIHMTVEAMIATLRRMAHRKLEDEARHKPRPESRTRPSASGATRQGDEP